MEKIGTSVLINGVATGATLNYNIKENAVSEYLMTKRVLRSLNKYIDTLTEEQLDYFAHKAGMSKYNRHPLRVIEAITSTAEYQMERKFGKELEHVYNEVLDGNMIPIFKANKN